MTASLTPAQVDTRHAPPALPARPRQVTIASGFLAAASAMVFAGMLGIYLTQRAEALANGLAWLPEGVNLPLTQPNVMLFTLLMSSVTMQWAVNAVSNDDRPNTYLSLGITLLLGFATLNMAAYLFSIAKLDVAIASTLPILVYAIAGAHVVMLCAAMLFVALAAFRALGGRETSLQHDTISASALYWHVMVGVFCFIWYAIYVTK